MRVMFIGDCHANRPWMEHVLDIGYEARVDLFIQVGDFGFWPEYGFPQEVNANLKRLDKPMWALDGNHDFKGDGLDLNGYAAWGRDKDFHAPGLTWVPRGFVLPIAGLEMGFLGGAVSVDQGQRKENESWWAYEALTEIELLQVRKVDVWVTHDAPAIPPYAAFQKQDRFGPKINSELKIQRERMARAFDLAQPKLNIHGHWHRRYSQFYKGARVIGLSCEDDAAIEIIDF